MGMIFCKVLEMSMAAVVLMLAVLLIRVPLRRMPKWFMGVLWAVVAIRLLVPVQIQSGIGFMPNFGNITSSLFERETGSDDISTATQDGLDIVTTGQEQGEIAMASDAVQATKDSTDADSKPAVGSIVFKVLEVIWIVGVVLCFGYATASYIYMKKKTSASIRFKSCDRIYVCDEIDTPFVFGFFKPVIYLPSGLDHKTIMNVISHEKVHLKRLDHIRKQFGFVIVSIHWFNPIVWLCYAMFCKDIELACDEKVISGMSSSEKMSYAESLLSCSTQKRQVIVYPVAFGEVGVKTRVLQIFNYRKASAFLIAVLVMITGVLATCSFTRAADKFVVPPIELKELNDVEESKTVPEIEIKGITYTGEEDEEEEISVGVRNLPYVEGSREKAVNMPKKTDDQVVVEVSNGASVYEQENASGIVKGLFGR